EEEGLHFRSEALEVLVQGANLALRRERFHGVIRGQGDECLGLLQSEDWPKVTRAIQAAERDLFLGILGKRPDDLGVERSLAWVLPQEWVQRPPKHPSPGTIPAAQAPEANDLTMVDLFWQVPEGRRSNESPLNLLVAGPQQLDHKRVVESIASLPEAVLPH